MTFPILGGNGAVAGYSIDNSLRFNDNDSSNLNITPSGAGNRDTFTTSFWVKRGNLGTAQRLWSAGTSIGTNNNNVSSLLFESNDTLKFFGEVGGSASFTLQTNQLFRDVSAWYHIVLAVDTTQSTSSNRVKIYVNGNQITSFSTETYMSQNTDTFYNATNLHTISYSGSAFVDGYIAEFVHIDGTQLTPTSFGETDEDSGIWKPIDVSGLTFGTNGFYLDFSDRNTQHTLTVNGDTEHSTTQNKIGSTSIKFDGTGDYLTATSSDFAFQLQDFTAEAWIYPTSLYNYIAIFSTRANNLGYPEAFHLGIDANGRITSYSDRNIAQSATGAITTNSWQHVALVRQGMTHRIYVDGTQVASGSDTDSTTRTLLGIGAIPSGQEALTGFIDEIRISDNARYPDGTSFTPYTSALTEDENTVLLIHSDTTNGSTTFTDSSGSAGGVVGLGADQSGNGNNFTTTNLLQNDQVLDSPTNNFATIDVLSSGAGTFSDGNTKYISTTDTGNGNFGTSSGKFYMEVKVVSNSNSFIGILDISKGLSPTRGGSWSSHGAIAYKANGDQYQLTVGGTSSTASYGSSYTTGDIIGIAFDVDADTITFYKNNVSQGNTTNGLSYISSDGVYSILLYGTNSTFVVNFGQDSTFAGNETRQNNSDGNGYGDFYYAPPSGYLALCTQNLATELSPTIDDGSQYFNSVLYTGNGSTQSITGVGFQPDTVWVKERSSTSGHQLRDSSRGVNKVLYPSATSAEGDDTNLTSFDSDGFSVGVSNGTNESGQTYVAWQWKASGGTTSSNTSGSITSTVQANTTAGFSIVTFTGNATAGATVGHGLGVKPEIIFSKNRSIGTNWNCYVEATDNTGDYTLTLNGTGGRSNSFNMWNDTAPTSSVITLGNRNETNGSSHNMVHFVFHSVEGYSKMGKYTGNGSSNGTFVYTGFRPAFLMIKRSDGVTNWATWDNKRDTYNEMFHMLQPNVAGAEITDANPHIDFTSNGFKFRTSWAGQNASGGTYIYMCFAESPFCTSTGIPVTAR